MSNSLDEIELRSEEIQEILSHIPSWMLRWGNTLMVGIIILLLFLSWLVEYPEIIKAEVIITTRIPPQKEFAQVAGKIDTFYIKDSEIVYENSVLAVIENTANTNDVFHLKSILEKIIIEKKKIYFPIHEVPILSLGIIESAYGDFENAYMKFVLNKSLNPMENENRANTISINELKLRLEFFESQLSLSQSEFDLKNQNLNRHKNLLEKGIISQLEYEKLQMEVLSATRELRSLEAQISQTRESIANSEKNYDGIEINKTEINSELARNVIQSFNRLKKSISDWEQMYVLRSEIEGKVVYLNYWNTNQTVNKGDLIFTIIPKNNLGYIAKANADANNSGKIKIGQKVNIKLNNYPETEFGILRGVVSNISQAPDNRGYYLLDISFPNNSLITNYNKQINFQEEMSGKAEIITEDLRLLERLFYQFRMLLNR